MYKCHIFTFLIFAMVWRVLTIVIHIHTQCVRPVCVTRRSLSFALLDMADVSRIVEMHGINFTHMSMTRNYIFTPTRDEFVLTLPHIASCIDAVDRWISSNRLKLNADKTQFIVLSSRSQLSKVKCDSIRLGGVDIPFLQKVTCFSVIVDAELSMVQHKRGVTSRYFYQLRQIRAIRKSLIAETSKLLVHAFINSTLDYCNSVLYVVVAVHLRKLQFVQMGLHGLSYENEIRPNQFNTSRRFILVACGITNPFQTLHAMFKSLHGLLRYISPRYVSNAHLTANTTSFDLLFVVNWLYPYRKK